MRKYRIVATDCTEFDLNNGWETKEFCREESKLFDTVEEMQKAQPIFIEELNISENEVVSIELQTLEVEMEIDEDDEEVISNIDIMDSETIIIDNSDAVERFRG